MYELTAAVLGLDSRHHRGAAAQGEAQGVADRVGKAFARVLPIKVGR